MDKHILVMLDTSDDSLFGNANTRTINTEESRKKFIANVQAAMILTFPEYSIAIQERESGDHIVSDDADLPIDEVIELVYQSAF